MQRCNAFTSYRNILGKSFEKDSVCLEGGQERKGSMKKLNYRFNS